MEVSPIFTTDNQDVLSEIHENTRSEPIQVATLSSNTKVPKEGNRGEKEEIRFKKVLFENRMNVEYCASLFGDDGQEGIEVINIETGKPYTNIIDIQKSKSMSKADVIIILIKTQKQLNISIKSKAGASPSIVNHTPRTANVFQHQYLTNELTYIDMLAEEYINKRKEGIIGEDIKIGMLDSYNNDPQIKNSLVKVLVYFTFKGTGSKRSLHECNAILIIHRDGLPSFILCETEEEKETYVQSIIDTCVISFRSKGMPKKTPDECMPWVYKNEKGKDCGSIHIRLSQH